MYDMATTVDDPIHKFRLRSRSIGCGVARRVIPTPRSLFKLEHKSCLFTKCIFTASVNVKEKMSADLYEQVLFLKTPISNREGTCSNRLSS